MSVRLIDIARQLQISPTSVSLAINGKPGVSAQTRERVKRLCEELGYKTNVATDTAQKGKITDNLALWIYKKHGLVVSDTPFFSALLEGIDEQSRKFGFNVVYTYYNESDNTREAVSAILERQDISGIILLATEMAEADLKPFIECKLPLVILDAYFPKAKLDTVLINNLQGAYEATCHLIEKGHRKIGHLKSTVGISNFKEREQGYLAALEEYGIPYEEAYDFPVASTGDGAYIDVMHLLEERRCLPTAFFADNDIIASGVMKAFKTHNVSIPGQVSIIGFDDIPFCEMVTPSLTTVKVYKQNMGRIAVERLVKQIEQNEDEYIVMRVGTKVIERESVDWAPGAE